MATAGTALAVTAGASGTGSYAATSLSPSGEWAAGGMSGNFSWSYPILVPGVAGTSRRI